MTLDELINSTVQLRDLERRLRDIEGKVIYTKNEDGSYVAFKFNGGFSSMICLLEILR